MSKYIISRAVCPLLISTAGNSFSSPDFLIKISPQELYIDSRLGAMTKEELLQLATVIAVEVATWSHEDQDRLEACREFCRSTCSLFGLVEQTMPLAHLWILITMIECKLGGCSGADIDESGMAVPKKWAPWTDWHKLNYYQRIAFLKEIHIMQYVLPRLENHAPVLFEAVFKLCKEIRAMISEP